MRVHSSIFLFLCKISVFYNFFSSVFESSLVSYKPLNGIQNTYNHWMFLKNSNVFLSKTKQKHTLENESPNDVFSTTSQKKKKLLTSVHFSSAGKFDSLLHAAITEHS